MANNDTSSEVLTASKNYCLLPEGEWIQYPYHLFWPIVVPDQIYSMEKDENE